VSAEVTAWPERLLLTALVVAVILLAAWGMWRGWQGRAQREAEQLHALAEVPSALGPVISELVGTYVGTVRAGQWMVRVLAHGLGAPGAAGVSVHPEGIVIDRDGQLAIFIPVAALRSVGTGRGLAGTVRERDGLVIIGWDWHGEALDTGIRSPDAQAQRHLMEAAAALISDQEGQPA